MITNTSENQPTTEPITVLRDQFFLSRYVAA
jgi:hypothetical protein